jgi:hypothetical protein
MKRIATYCMILAASVAVAEPDPAPEEPVAMNANWITLGARAYQVVNDGVIDGRIDVFSEFVDGELVIHDHSVSESLGLEEDIFMRLDGESFAPISVNVTGDSSGTHVSAAFRFADGMTQGEMHMHRQADGRHRTVPAEFAVPEGFLLRGSALYLANAMADIVPGGDVKLHWFNSLNGQLSEITLTVEGQETITVPAGTFDCLVVRQAGGQPGNLIYISREDRRIVRFDVVGQPMSLELLPDEQG